MFEIYTKHEDEFWGRNYFLVFSLYRNNQRTYKLWKWIKVMEFYTRHKIWKTKIQKHRYEIWIGDAWYWKENRKHKIERKYWINNLLDFDFKYKQRIWFIFLYKQSKRMENNILTNKTKITYEIQKQYKKDEMS